MNRFNGLPQAKVLKCFYQVCREQAHESRQEAAKESDAWLKGYAQGGAAALDWVVATLDLLIALGKKEAAEKETAEAVQDRQDVLGQPKHITSPDCGASVKQEVTG